MEVHSPIGHPGSATKLKGLVGLVGLVEKHPSSAGKGIRCILRRTDPIARKTYAVKSWLVDISTRDGSSVPLI
jgi:hypothetical protein